MRTWQKLLYSIVKFGWRILNGLGLFRIRKLSLLSLKIQNLAFKTVFRVGRNTPVIVNNHKMYLPSGFGPLVTENYESATLSIIGDHISKDMTVLDIGAHIGFYSLHFARLVGNEGKVYSFEPHPGHFELLNRNIKENGYGNISSYNVAVSNQAGSLPLYISNLDSGLHSLHFSDILHSGNTVQIKCVTLDEFFQQSGRIPVHFIKMDIEGSEAAAIKGGADLLANQTDLKLISEFNIPALRSSGVEPAQLLQNLAYAGFKLWQISEQGELISIDDFSRFVSSFDNSGMAPWECGCNVFGIKQ